MRPGVVEFGILGPLEVLREGRPVEPPPGHLRWLLGILLLHDGELVTDETLATVVWGPNGASTAALRTAVSRLRKWLGGPWCRIERAGDGYRLVVPAMSVDARRFRTGLADAATGRGTTTGDVDSFSVLQRALDEWRSGVLAGSPDWVRGDPAVAWLEFQRRESACRLGSVAVRNGRAGDALPYVAQMLTDHPLDEPLHATYLTLLTITGRPAEALHHYEKVRSRLRDELGVDPSPGLQKAHLELLRGDVESHQGSPATPAQLPAQANGFTGRHSELRTLDAFADRVRAAQPATGILAIEGAAAVGKTALAVQWTAMRRHLFPDGQLYVNLRGFDADPPMRPIEALAMFLRGLGVAANLVPTNLEEAAALYRSLLAERRVAVILDNARDPEQIRPLLPGPGDSIVLVTSRTSLEGLSVRDGAQRLVVARLPRRDARVLLGNLLGSGRVDRESEAADELAGLCAYLPLALRVVAAALAHSPNQDIAGYVAQVRTGDRLARLAVDSDDQAVVRVTFDLSYVRLPSLAQRMFRLLGLVPGTDVTPEAAATLSGTTVEAAQRQLEVLSRAYLVEQVSSHRYSQHDLLRLYAADRARQEEVEDDREAAMQRLFSYYADNAHDAAMVCSPFMFYPAEAVSRRVEARTPIFSGHQAAIAWLDAERANLVATTLYAARHGFAATAVDLALALRGYFFHRLHSVDWLTTCRAGVAAARRQGEAKTLALMHISLGSAHWRINRDSRTALRHLRCALDSAQDADFPHAQTAVLLRLADIHRRDGRLPQAAADLARALRISKQFGPPSAMALTLHGLGILQSIRGRLASAHRYTSNAHMLYKEIEAVSGQATTLANLAELNHWLGHYAMAQDQFKEALRTQRRIENRNSEAEALRGLAALLHDVGQPKAALEHAIAALRLTNVAGSHPHLRAAALNTAGTILLTLGDGAAAADFHQQALTLAGNAERCERTAALIGIAEVDRWHEDHDAALHHTDEAKRLAREDGYLMLEGLALVCIAQALLAKGEMTAARSSAVRATRILHSVGYAAGRSRAQSIVEAAAPTRPRT